MELLASAVPPKKMVDAAQAPARPRVVSQPISHKLGTKKRELAKRTDATIVAPPMRQMNNEKPAERIAVATKEPAEATPVKASPAISETAVKARESRVRNHLEHYKYYPASARLRGIEGEVELSFQLAPGGRAEKVRVLASSGYQILDQAALETVSRAQPFPATAGQYQFRLRFRRL